jgi:hypothetical protein
LQMRKRRWKAVQPTAKVVAVVVVDTIAKTLKL